MVMTFMDFLLAIVCSLIAPIVAPLEFAKERAEHWGFGVCVFMAGLTIITVVGSIYLQWWVLALFNTLHVVPDCLAVKFAWDDKPDDDDDDDGDHWAWVG